MHLEQRHVVRSLKIRFKTDFAVKYACRQLKLAPGREHKCTKSDCEITAIEIKHMPAKCDLFYMAKCKTNVATFGFSAGSA